MIEDKKLIAYFVGLLGQIKVFHWATTEYNKHQALDNLYSAMNTIVDKLIESYIGRYKKQPLKTYKISTEAHTDMTKLDTFLETECENIRKLLQHFKGVSEIQSLIDDMLIAFNQTIYLCNLK